MPETHFDAGLVRKVWATEGHKLRDHFLRLDAGSRRLRFGHSVSETFVREYAERVSNQFDGLTYGYFEDGELRAAAELRRLGESWGSEAEAAFSVEPGWQKRGIGSELMGRVIRAARNRGVRHLYMSCLAENAVMQRIAKKNGAKLRFEYGEVIGDIVPESATSASFFDEVMEDSRGFLLAVLDIDWTRSGTGKVDRSDESEAA